VIWFAIRKAKIDPGLRLEFERYGVAAIQQLLVAMGGSADVRFEGRLTQDDPDFRPAMLDWLTEQYDRAERKETWQITMEAAVTVFVLAELCFSIFSFFWKG
jgi:hypothetical protein